MAEIRKQIRESSLLVRRRSDLENIYHCCVQKTASRWIRGILFDHRVFQHCGLRPLDYEATLGPDEGRGALQRNSSEALIAKKRIVTPLYMDYPSYNSIPKRMRYRAFFVSRDPRDIVVSWYFSMKASHGLMGGFHSQIRDELQVRDKEAGLLHSIWALDTRAGLFDAMRSWSRASDPFVLSVRFEDLTTDRSARATWRRLMDHCKIHLPKSALSGLLNDHSFEKLSGRRKGAEDTGAHLRKGVTGDWRNHFTPAVRQAFTDTTGDLLESFGYE